MTTTNSGINQYLDKNFWSRGEGKFGKILLWGAGIAGAVFGTLFFGPLVVTATAILAAILSNLLNMTITAGVLFAIGYALSDPKFRGLFGFGYRTLIRKLWGIAVDLSPKAVLDDILAGLRENYSKLEKQIGNFRSRMKKTEAIYESNKANMEKSLQLARAAQKQAKEHEKVLHSRDAERYRQFGEKLKAILVKMEVILRILIKMREGAEFKLRDTESQVRMSLLEHSALMDAAAATEEAMRIIKGDPHKQELFDMAMDKLASDAAAALGEIDNFMDVSEKFFSSVDLEKAIADENALKLLEEWERKMDSKLLGPGVKQDIINSAANPNAVLEDNVQNPAPQRRVIGGSKYFES